MIQSSLILAGPILRHTTSDHLCVWLAARHNMDLELEILDQACTPLTLKRAQQKRTSFQLGEQSELWVILLELDASLSSLPKDQLLHYNIRSANTPLPVNIDLSDVCLNDLPYPSFFIPSTLENITHGSCRKPHGPSKFDENTTAPENEEFPPDGLSVLASYLEENATDLTQRPALLCLTGDQIYADDVADSLIGTLSQKAKELLGQNIKLPGLQDHTKPRGEIAEQSGLTSGHAKNHLLSLGEYAAMYLFAFGNIENWELEYTNNKEDRYLQDYIRTLPEVRKALANIPTYMIFDDHEVTDDWNLTREWYDNVRFNDSGRRIISNGLATYYLFQHWGNSPNSIDEDLLRIISRHINQPENKAIGEAYDLSLWKNRQWNYVVPTNPPLLVLDTRTQRDFDGEYRPSPLLDRYALDWLRVSWAKLQSRGQQKTPIIISSTPVIGFDPIEQGQKILIRPFTTLFGFKFTLAAATLDLESWIASRKGFSTFLDTLLLRMKINKVVFLSGDVHYSFTNKASYEVGSDKLQCLQLTSSALHNCPGAGKFLDFLASLKEKREEVHRGLRPLARIPWWQWPILSKEHKAKHKYPFWKTSIQGVKSSDAEHNRLLTRRPNFGLVKLKEGEVTQHIHISGRKGNYSLRYDIE